MKRVTLWIVGAGIVGVAFTLTLQARERQAKAPAAKPPAAVTPPVAEAPAETIAFTFTDEATMEQFARFWQQRQATLTRMTVLQAYWKEEQANVQQANEQLLSQYNLDVSKNYTLDAKRRVLLETGTVSAPGETPAQADQPVPQP